MSKHYIKTALVILELLILSLLGQANLSAQEDVDLPLVAPESVPTSGTFFLLSSLATNGFAPPFPYNPFAEWGADVFSVGTNIFMNAGPGSFIVDDTAEAFSRYQETTPVTAEPPPAPGPGAGDDTNGVSPAYAYGSNSFWIEILSATGGFANLVLHGTAPNVTYELFSKEALTNVAWVSEGTVLGSLDQDWTPATVTMGTRTNSLFLWARSWVDSDGDGLPDWWESLYGLDPNDADTDGTGILDGYKDLAGDGWTTLYKYEHGLNPRQPIIPPPPRNLSARLDATGTNVTLTWDSGGGSVANYLIMKEYWGNITQLGQVNSATFIFPDVHPNGFLLPYPQPSYLVRANFLDGTHADSTWIKVSRPDLNLDITILRGPSGQRFLAVGSPPAGLSHVAVMWDLTWTNIFATNLVNGIALLPSINEEVSHIYCQAIATNGTFGETFEVPRYPEAFLTERYVSEATAYHFVDARQHLKENLKFLLRAATLTRTFDYCSTLMTVWPYNLGSHAHAQPEYANAPEDYYARPSSPSSYEYSGFHIFSSNLNYSVMQELRPVKEHYIWRNFVFHTNDFNSTGVSWDDFIYMSAASNAIRTLEDPLHIYGGDGSETSIPLAFTNLDDRWLIYGEFGAPYYSLDAAADIGLVPNATTGWLKLSSDARNVYGLYVKSLRVDERQLILPNTVPGPDSGYYSLEFDNPGFQTSNYYFVSQTPHFRFGAVQESLPGAPDFTTAATSPVLFASVGNPITVAGWAKMAITNGYPGKFAYLEQYFDKAYKIDGTGNITTNETGLLSPYGEFFPTEPGPAALRTMPDIETDQRGTGVVNVIKLQLDVNHDGIMDLSFRGPDNTSTNRPFVFWVNSDSDIRDRAGDPGHELEDAVLGHSARDCDNNFIESQRDLEDFARLWICGMPAAVTNQDYSISLSMVADSGAPGINLFSSVESNGGTGYLTDTNIAWLQTSNSESYPNPRWTIARISAGQSYVLLNASLTNNGNKCFLFEGAGAGRGRLVLTIARGTNVLAQTSAWLDIREISGMFEHAHAENVDLGGAPATNVSTFKLDNTLVVDSSEDPQIVLYIHGLNNTEAGYESNSQTIFKRLYWEGYRGRFATFRWPSPTWSVFPVSTTQISPLNYNTGEYISWKSATGLKGYIASLKSRFPNYVINVAALSTGGVLANEAIRLGAPVDNCAMAMVTFPAGAFDGDNTNLFYSALENGLSSPDENSQGGYKNCFNDATRRVNFYNDDDYACFQGPFHAWEFIQKMTRPAHTFSLPGWNYEFDGTNCFFEFTDENNLPISTRLVTEDYEKKSFVARSRTKAIGAAGLKYAPFALAHGSITNNISLQDATLGFVGGATFGSSRAEHSGELTKTIQDAIPFYRNLMETGFRLHSAL